ncbi:MAG: thioredoxin domain-containing protein [Balneolaceae bacterium]|nr:thioredoxin domain-containing protein [Balneolaceae bacterium]MBO6545446.1 thioredoxin domain-containing protein [Balneolaceae bacterium]MBO6646842.1 thioredoxin domain-containing protein [Balneolaceae bacterium]
MKSNLFFNVLIALVVIGFACEKSPETNLQSQAASETTAASSVEAEQPVNAKVELVKFSDYQCPACKYFVPFVNQLKQDYGDDIKVTYKHFPLSMHPYAHVAARSVEAARVQGKFQEMHDMIFEGQEQWSRGNAEAIFIGYARALELDVQKFQQDMNSADMNRIVMADRREGRDLGISSTPTFFINGVEMESNPNNYPAFKAVIDQYMD